MSTNFYLVDMGLSRDPIHLGKRYNVAPGKTGWATDASHGLFKEAVDLLWYLLICPLTAVVMDEYNNLVTHIQMMDIIMDTVEQKTLEVAFT